MIHLAAYIGAYRSSVENDNFFTAQVLAPENISNGTQSISPRPPNMYPSYKKDRALIGTFIFSTLFAQVASDDPKSGSLRLSPLGFQW